MFESGARAVGATVLPAGTGQTELQAKAGAHLGATAYAGTPDYLKVILEEADAQGLTLPITKAAVSGGALFPSLREWYRDRGITCLQAYATADLGNVAYESPAMEGLIVDEHVVVEIVTPGTGRPVPAGEVGEVVVTALTPEYPLIRFATGDLSAVLPGQSPCGRTNLRIKGWMGRADQTAKIKGMFVRPEQVAELVAKLPGVDRARVIVTRAGEQDQMQVQLETAATLDPEVCDAAIRATLNCAGRWTSWRRGRCRGTARSSMTSAAMNDARAGGAWALEGDCHDISHSWCCRAAIGQCHACGGGEDRAGDQQYRLCPANRCA